MPHVDDWELVARARSGEVEAFAELVDRYQGPVIHFCRRMITSKEDAEDLAQETFLRLYRALDRIAPKAKFSTLLFGIARNLTRNFIRDGKRRGHDRVLPLEKADPVRADAVNRPDRRAHGGEIAALIEEALAQLSPEHREILILREIEDQDYESMAEILGCRIGTVRSRLARAREQVRQHILELGGELL
jgi:RNA polymerase sigma-70 factor, ECF subfamily